MLMDGLEVVLVNTRFPENIGMAARACANMGCPILRLVQPERWDRSKALPLATQQGQALLNTMTIHASLNEAVADSVLVIGTTARVGGWRRGFLSPGAAALEAANALAQDERVSLVFGPEDRGLSNENITHCPQLVTIPVEPGARSLNLAQAVLIMTWECAKAVRRHQRQLSGAGMPLASSDTATKSRESAVGRKATADEQERLLRELKHILLQVDVLHGDNPDYFLLPWRRMLCRAGLRRHEYDALMGLCRQLRHKLGGDTRNRGR